MLNRKINAKQILKIAFATQNYVSLLKIQDEILAVQMNEKISNFLIEKRNKNASVIYCHQIIYFYLADSIEDQITIECAHQGAIYFNGVVIKDLDLSKYLSHQQISFSSSEVIDILLDMNQLSSNNNNNNNNNNNG